MHASQDDPIWLLYQKGMQSGPYTWEELILKAHGKGILSDAMIRRDYDLGWYPASQFIHPSLLYDVELQGILPSKYDLFFYSGVGLFILGFTLFLFTMWLGIPFLLASPVVEIYALVEEKKNRPKSFFGTIGTVFASIWIIIQLIVTSFFMIAVLTTI